MNNIMLSEYLIKKIIIILCDFINDKNLLIQLHHYKNERYKRLKCKLAMVCWKWFKMVSNYLTVSVNCHNLSTTIPSSKYLITKIENIETLRLLYKRQYNQQEIEFINKNIQSTINLKSIVIERISSLDISLIKFNGIIKCNEVYLDQDSTLSLIDQDKTKIFVNFLSVYPLEYNKILESFQKFHEINSICCVFDVFPIKEIFYNDLETKLTNSLFSNNLQSITIFRNSCTPSLSIDDLVILLKSLPNLKQFEVGICLNNLIFNLTNNNIGNDGGSGCEICKEFNRQPVLNAFELQWIQFCDLIINHKLLTSLSINHSCFSTLYTNNPLPIDFINKFSYPFIENKSIKKLQLYGFHTLSLIEMLLTKSTTITDYNISFNSSRLNNILNGGNINQQPSSSSIQKDIIEINKLLSNNKNNNNNNNNNNIINSFYLLDLSNLKKNELINYKKK